MSTRALKLANTFLRGVGLQVVRSQSPNIPQIGHRTTNDGIQYTYERLPSLVRYAPWLDDEAFYEIYERAKAYTLVDIYRCYELWDLVREVQEIPGDILEVGVWRGGTGAILAKAAKSLKHDAMVYLCDTFEGVVKAGAFDERYKGGEHADTSAELVSRMLAENSLQNTRVLKGIFPDETADRLRDAPLSLIHVDVDVYESAKGVVEWILPRLSPRGVVVFDDYGFMSCPGVARLVNELHDTGKWDFFYNLNGHAVLRLKALVAGAA